MLEEGYRKCQTQSERHQDNVQQISEPADESGEVITAESKSKDKISTSEQTPEAVQTDIVNIRAADGRQYAVKVWPDTTMNQRNIASGYCRQVRRVSPNTPITDNLMQGYMPQANLYGPGSISDSELKRTWSGLESPNVDYSNPEDISRHLSTQQIQLPSQSCSDKNRKSESALSIDAKQNVEIYLDCVTHMRGHFSSLDSSITNDDQELESICLSKAVNSYYCGTVEPEKATLFQSLYASAELAQDNHPLKQAIQEPWNYSFHVSIKPVTDTQDIVDGRENSVAAGSSVQEISRYLMLSNESSDARSSQDYSVKDHPLRLALSNTTREDSASINIAACVLLAQRLHKIGEARDWGTRTAAENSYRSIWLSDKLSERLTQQLADPLMVVSKALPRWCDLLLKSAPHMFPFQLRKRYFYLTAFGVSHSVYTFLRHEMQDSNTRNNSTPSMNGNVERNLRLRRQRVTVDRKDIVADAMKVFEMHASSKALLEINFSGEKGSGLGPTLEFYSSVAFELQSRRGLGQKLWLSEEDESDFINQDYGLFPRELAKEAVVAEETKQAFSFLGSLVAKVIQDRRIIPLPISSYFIDLVLSRPFNREALLRDVYKDKGEIIISLIQFSSLQSQHCDTMNQKIHYKGSEFALEDLQLFFDDERSVNEENLSEYIAIQMEKLLYGCNNGGICAQIYAFRAGFESVFPLSALETFSTNEIVKLFSGEQVIDWTRTSLEEYIMPEHGYTSDNMVYQYLLQVLVDLSQAQRHHFLQFVTGCPNLPPGGLCNISPKIKIHPKVEDGDHTLPSASTCFHVLKLPRYSSKQVLEAQLIVAIESSRGLIDLT